MNEDASMLRPAVFLDRDGTLMVEVHYCADPALVRLFPGTAAALRRLNERGYLCVIITNQSGIGRGLLTEAQYHAVQAELLRQLETQEEGENQELRNSGGDGNTGNKGTGTPGEIEFRNPRKIGEPEGFQANSRGLSEETPPEPALQTSHPEGVADSRPPLIAASYFCPDATPSPRRKPEPGMVLEAARDLGIDLARSWFVGDKAADIACGERAGTRTILVQTGYGTKTAAMGCDPAPDFIVKDIAEAAEVVLQNRDALR